MEINYDKWKNRWSTNEVIVLVLLSLGMQIGLIALAPLRKRTKNTVLKLTLWLLYLTADSVATLALGNISNQANPEESGDSGTMPGKLTVLWAPFLLLHLGGPDSITSYSVEDNELWWRHLLGLVVQVIVTIYVFWQSPPKGLMWIPTMLVFIPGLIKFAERTHALRLGSKDNLKDKIISELSPINFNKQDKNDKTTSDLDNSANGTTKDKNDNTTPNPINPLNGTTKDKNNNTTSNPVNPANGTTKDSNNNTTSNLVDPENGITKDSNDNTTSNLIDPVNGTTKDNNDNTTSKSIDPTNGTAKDGLDESEKDSKAICDGYYWFNKFKRLLVDVTFPADLLMESQDHFSEMDAKDALELVAIELSFLYDILHTKAVHMHYNLGRTMRCFSLVSIIAALVVFHHLDMQKYASKDIIITYILFGAGLILEVIAAVLLISSDWTVVSLRKKGWRKCIANGITSMVKGIFRKGKNRWSRNIGQFNLVGLCLRERYTSSNCIMKKVITIKRKWDNMRESRSIPLVQGKFEDIMFTEAKRRAQNVHIYNVLKEARSYRGGKSLERHGQLKNLEWCMKREFDELIILWHVATDICYYGEFNPNPPNSIVSVDTERDVSWKTSNYMLYLLTQQQSMMQLGYGMRGFEAICDVVKKKFKGKGKLKHKKAREELYGAPLDSELNDAQEPADSHQPTDDAQGQADGHRPTDVAQEPVDGFQPTNKKDIFVLNKIWAYLRCWGRRKGEKDRRKVEKDNRRQKEEERAESVLKDCCQLAAQLNKLNSEIKWKLISEIWMEMLGYAAINCDSYQHAKSLRRGGELLTHLWLLMSQLGVVEEHKMQQYQSGSV